MRTRVALLLVLMTGCLPDSEFPPKYVTPWMFNEVCSDFVIWEKVPIIWSFSCEFGDYYREDVRAAANYWNEIVGKEILVESDSCDEGVIVFDGTEVESTHTAVVTYAAKCHQAVSEWQWVMALFSEWFERGEVVRFKVARHEFGHVLGLDHSFDKGCQMYPYIFDDKLRECKGEIEAVRLTYGN